MFKKNDKKSIAQFKKILVGMKEKLTSEIKQISDDASNQNSNSSGDVSGHALHMADVATDMYDREFSLGLASNERELLQRIDGALKRIEQNKFGMCEECQKPIPMVRLKAIPYVQTCMKCQEKLETKGR